MSDDAGYIHRFVRGEEATTVLLLHGTGGSEEDLLGVGRSIAPRANLLSPRGKSLDEGLPRFFRRFAEGKFDEQDIIFRASELADFVTAAATRYQFDPQRVMALGYSNGANIAAALMLLRPQALAGGILLRAMVPLEPNPLPDLSGKPVLMCQGRNDAIVPVENAERLANMFRAAAANLTIIWSHSGHALTQDDFSACASWLNQKASSPPAPRA